MDVSGFQTGLLIALIIILFCRDDDNDASDSDGDQESLALTLKQKEAERRKLEERILAAEEGKLMDSDSVFDRLSVLHELN